MKILHLCIARKLTQGQIKQLRFENAAANEFAEIKWTTKACHDYDAYESFVETIPRIFRVILMRNLYGWLVAYKLSKDYDYILMRHMTFDPFALIFSPFIHNRVSVHHAKEVEELLIIRAGWKGKFASALERFTGRVAARNALALFGVTEEIAEYERNTRSPGKPIGVYSNGIDPDQVPVLEDNRNHDTVNAAFMCGTFSEWHGLDKLIDAVDQYQPLPESGPFIIHLIGGLSEKQLKTLGATDQRKAIFRIHGSMSDAEYRPLLANCDVGIASLAMERQNLREGSTLKVREMLAMGLPVYSGHEDIALPKDEPFACIVKIVSIDSIISFGMLNKFTSRVEIRKKSLKSIAKKEIMLGVSNRLSEIHI